MKQITAKCTQTINTGKMKQWYVFISAIMTFDSIIWLISLGRQLNLLCRSAKLLSMERDFPPIPKMHFGWCVKVLPVSKFPLWHTFVALSHLVNLEFKRWIPHNFAARLIQVFTLLLSEENQQTAKMPRIMIKGGVWRNTEVRVYLASSFSMMLTAARKS